MNMDTDWRLLVLPIALNIDYENCSPLPITVSSLKDLCGKTLVSDVCLIRNIVERLPKAIQHYLLDAAIKEGRVLSQSHLLKYYPEETFKIPLLPLFENWYVIYQLYNHYKRGNVCKALHAATDSAMMLLKSFFSIINTEINSPLHTLDLSEIPLPPRSLLHIGNYVSNKENIQMGKKYILKIGCFLADQHYLTSLYHAIRAELEGKSNLKIIVTGLHWFFSSYDDNVVADFLNILDVSELRSFSLNFCKFSHDILFTRLHQFTSLTALELSQINFNISTSDFLIDCVASAFQELTQLRRLCLSGWNIRGTLQMLFQMYCLRQNPNYKRQKIETGENCCLVHRGRLEFINFSNCELYNEDLNFLASSHLSKSLLNLNFTHCMVDINCFCGMLTAMSSKLIILNIADILYPTADFDLLFSTLGSMEKLKCLNLNGLHFNMNTTFQLAHALSKLPNLKLLSLTYPREGDRAELETKFIHILNKKIEIFWNEF